MATFLNLSLFENLLFQKEKEPNYLADYLRVYGKKNDVSIKPNVSKLPCKLFFNYWENGVASKKTQSVVFVICL